MREIKYFAEDLKREVVKTIKFFTPAIVGLCCLLTNVSTCNEVVSAFTTGNFSKEASSILILDGIVIGTSLGLLGLRRVLSKNRNKNRH